MTTRKELIAAVGVRYRAAPKVVQLNTNRGDKAATSATKISVKSLSLLRRGNIDGVYH
jgi:hypothetical protein